jgi:acetylornithine/N-succinyldiaminopimelate aminotransferase
VLDVMLTPSFLDRVDALSRSFRAQLEAIARRHPKAIAELRGVGLHLGLRVVPPNGEFVDALRAEGLLSVAAGDNVVRILPPLTVSETELRQGAEIIERVATRKAKAEKAA